MELLEASLVLRLYGVITSCAKWDSYSIPPSHWVVSLQYALVTSRGQVRHNKTRLGRSRRRTALHTPCIHFSKTPCLGCNNSSRICLFQYWITLLGNKKNLGLRLVIRQFLMFYANDTCDILESSRSMSCITGSVKEWLALSGCTPLQPCT